jgi:hypothetical protein
MLTLVATLGICSVLAGAIAAQRRVELRSTAVQAHDVPLVLLLTALLSFSMATYQTLVPSAVWWAVLLAYELVAGAIVGNGAAKALRNVLTPPSADPGDEDLVLHRPRPHVPFMYYTALCLIVPLWPILVPVAPLSL